MKTALQQNIVDSLAQFVCPKYEIHYITHLGFKQYQFLGTMQECASNEGKMIQVNLACFPQEPFSSLLKLNDRSYWLRHNVNSLNTQDTLDGKLTPTTSDRYIHGVIDTTMEIPAGHRLSTVDIQLPCNAVQCRVACMKQGTSLYETKHDVQISTLLIPEAICW